MGIIKKLDDKLMALVVEPSRSSDVAFKWRSFLTIMTIGIPYSVFTLYKGINAFSKLLFIGAIIYGILVSVMAGYEWRYFFTMRKKGLNHDRNYFFEESAGKFRKIVFYAALLLLAAIDLFHIGRQNDLRYILRTEFYVYVGLNILRNILHVIVILELSRVIIRSAAGWSGKKHFVFVVLFSFILSVLSAVGLSLSSGHGSF